MGQITFSEDDVKQLRAFGSLIATKAKFSDMSVADAVSLNRLLQAYNQVVIKVENHVLEVVRMTEPETTEKKSKK